MRRGHFLNTTGLSDNFYGFSPTITQDVILSQQTGTGIWPDINAFDFSLNHNGRGIIISNPLEISGSSVSIKNSVLDPSELRRALLFWDLIAWPASRGIYISGGPDEDFLISEKRMVRPTFNMDGDAATGLALSFMQTLKVLEKKNPGQWLMSDGGASLGLCGKDMMNDRGVLTTLSNLIPVPMHDMPLEDVLRFKDKRLPEIQSLRSALDGFYQNWLHSEDQDHQLMMAINAIDLASADMIKVAKESKNPFALSSWKMSFSLSAADVIKGFMGGKIFGLDTASSLLMGTASAISFSKDVGLKTAKRNSPYSYIASLHSELF